ncbi:MAG: MFS transporter [Flavisolibacter sp.]
MNVHKDKTDLREKRWRISAFFFLSGLITASWSSRIPDVQQKLFLNDAAWGTVLAALPCGLITGLFVAPFLVSRFGTQKTMVACGLLASILLCLLGISAGTNQLRLVLFFVGFVRTIWSISMNTGAVELQKNYGRPIVSRLHGLWSLACFAAAALGTLMIVRNIVPAFHFLIIALFCFPLSLFFGIRSKKESVFVTDSRPLLTAPDTFIWLLGAIAFCVMTGESTMFDWSVNYFKQVVHASKDLVTTGYTCFIITMAVGRLAGDYFLHRHGMMPVLMVNGILMSVGFFIASLFPSFFSAALGFLFIGLGDSIIVPTIYSLAARSNRLQPGFALTTVTLVGYVGFLSAPLLIGFLSHRWNMRLAFALIGLLAALIPFLTHQASKQLSSPNLR